MDKETPYINKGLDIEKSTMLNDFIINYFVFIENMKLPLLNNMQYFSMSTNLESELLLGVQRLIEKIPNLKFASSELNYIFELTKEELFYEKGDYIYLMILFGGIEFNYFSLGQIGKIKIDK